MRTTRANHPVVLLVRRREAGTEGLVRNLERCGYSAIPAHTPAEVVGELTRQICPIVLLDLVGFLKTPDSCEERDGGENEATESLKLLRKIRRTAPDAQVVVLVGDGVDLATCCQAVAYGAASFVDWHDGQPLDELADRLDQAHKRYQAAVHEGKEIHNRTIFDQTGVAGKSEIMAKLLFQARRAALISDAPVLITGESGTGKQLLAEAIHRMDPKRRSKPFLTVNCAAITGTLAESVLFGHRKGAFTGATEDRPGLFRAAHGGTLLLDEIGELSRPLQPKLLRVLQEGCVMPVGDHVEKEVDVRVAAATNRALPVLIEKGEFRLDLYQRLNVITLNVPSLRERPEDVPLLVQFFLRRYAGYCDHPIESVDERVYEVLARSVGGGNVRELENAVRQILAFKTAGNRIELSDIPPELIARQIETRTEAQVSESLASVVESMLRTGRMTLADVLEEFEGMIFREALARSNGTHADLARRLGLSRRTFYNKLQKYSATKPV